LAFRGHCTIFDFPDFKSLRILEEFESQQKELNPKRWIN
jgi:hypothetical protein